MGGNFLNPNMSVQRYHSQFIKEGLKMKVKQKIKEEPIGDGGKLEVEDIKKEHEVSYHLEYLCIRGGTPITCRAWHCH